MAADSDRKKFSFNGIAGHILTPGLAESDLRQVKEKIELCCYLNPAGLRLGVIYRMEGIDFAIEKNVNLAT